MTKKEATKTVRRRALLLAAMPVLGLCGAAHGTVAAPADEAWPRKPIRWIVPFLPGTAPDSSARVLADAMAPLLKQNIIIDNRAGAAGNLGADVVAKAAPDGYTLAMLSGVHTANTAFYRRIPFQLDKDFVPVKALGDSAVLIAASRDAPFKDVPQFLQQARAQPGRLQLGSTTSLTLDLLKVQAGVDVQLVPYKGVGEALQDLVGGRLDLVAGPALQMLPLIRDGRIRPLGLASTRRVPELPGVATFAEHVPGYDAGMWYGLFAPAGTPAEPLQRLHAQLDRILAQPALRRQLAVQGIDLAFASATPQQVRERMQAEIARWRLVAARTGNYAN